MFGLFVGVVFGLGAFALTRRSRGAGNRPPAPLPTTADVHEWATLNGFTVLIYQSTSDVAPAADHNGEIVWVQNTGLFFESDGVDYTPRQDLDQGLEDFMSGGVSVV